MAPLLHRAAIIILWPWERCSAARRHACKSRRTTSFPSNVKQNARCPFPWGNWTPSNTYRPTRVHIPNIIFIGSAVLQGSRSLHAGRQTDRQTDRPRFSVCSSRPQLANAAMRLNNDNDVYSKFGPSQKGGPAGSPITWANLRRPTSIVPSYILIHPPFGHNRHGPQFIRCVRKLRKWRAEAAVPLSVGGGELGPNLAQCRLG